MKTKTDIYPRSFPRHAPDSFVELAKTYLPRSISDEIAYQSAMEFVNWLAVRANNPEQLDFLKSVTHLLTSTSPQNARSCCL